jgi:hypothetical protein
MNVPALFRHPAWPPGGPSSLALPAHSRAEQPAAAPGWTLAGRAQPQTPVIATQEEPS